FDALDEDRAENLDAGRSTENRTGEFDLHAPWDEHFPNALAGRTARQHAHGVALKRRSFDRAVAEKRAARCQLVRNALLDLRGGGREVEKGVPMGENGRK